MEIGPLPELLVARQVLGCLEDKQVWQTPHCSRPPGTSPSPREWQGRRLARKPGGRQWARMMKQEAWCGRAHRRHTAHVGRLSQATDWVLSHLPVRASAAGLYQCPKMKERSPSGHQGNGLGWRPRAHLRQHRLWPPELKSLVTQLLCNIGTLFNLFEPQLLYLSFFF